MNFINFNEIFNRSKNDSTFAIKYLQDLFNYNNDYLKYPIKCNYPLAAIKSFIPLPDTLIITDSHTNNDKIIKNADEYQFHGKPGNRILHGNKVLPNSDNVPIPFSFPIYSNQDVEILQSNVYYFEVKIENNKNLTQSWDSECVSIGFGNKSIPFNSHVGWYCGSFGYHSDDGTVRYSCLDPSKHDDVQGFNSIVKKVSCTWKPGDIAGAGLIYIDTKRAIPFFTLNGKLVYTSDKPLYLFHPYFPVVGYDHSHSITVNFSNRKFVFNIKDMINNYSTNVISHRNTLIDNFDISKFLNYPTTTPATTMNINADTGSIIETNDNHINEELAPFLIQSTQMQENPSLVNINLSLVIDIINKLSNITSST